eukprot:4938368-Alexandrium_andersonii.AAC.1
MDQGVGCVSIRPSGLAEPWHFITAHLPHNWGPNAPSRDLREEQWQLRLDLIAKFWKVGRSVLGLDANARVGNFQLDP